MSTALEKFHDGYSHIDLAGVSLFNAGNDRETPKFGPVFKALGKPVFGMRDEPNRPDPPDVKANINTFDKFWQSPEKGIERILVKETPHQVLHRFLSEVSTRDDYPADCNYDPSIGDVELKHLVQKVLKARKGDSYGFGYAGILIEQCQDEEELPPFVRDALLSIDEHLKPSEGCVGVPEFSQEELSLDGSASGDQIGEEEL